MRVQRAHDRPLEGSDPVDHARNDRDCLRGAEGAVDEIVLHVDDHQELVTADLG